MPRYAVRFAEMYGDCYVQANTPQEAEDIAQRELAHWTGFGMNVDVQVDGLTIHDDMTEVVG